MTRGSWAALVGAVLLLAPGAGAQVVTCDRLLSDPYALVEAGTLSPDTIASFLDSGDMLCPIVSNGDDLPGQCEPWPEPDDLGPPPPNPEWDGLDYGWTLVQLFLSAENYGLCDDLFHQEGFVDLVSSIPRIEGERLEEYRFLARSQTLYTCDSVETEEPPIELDDLQRSLLSIHDSVAGWTYCARERAWAATGDSVLGFFGGDRQIAIYRDACYRDDLYGMDTSDLSPTHRAILIASHELGHAMGSLLSDDRTPTGLHTEDLATYFGTFFSECSARLLRGLVDCTRERAAEVPNLAKHDRRFLRCQSDRWRLMERRIQAVRADLAEDLDPPAPGVEPPRNWSGPCLATELRR